MKYNLQGKLKTFTLVGMSGSGKTSLSQKLSSDGFFHYSIDYEIAHTHLKTKTKDRVIAQIKRQSELFKNLIEKFAIKVDLSLTFDDLEIITMFVIPQQENGKILLEEFLHNQELYCQAEIKATMEFANRATIAFENYHCEGFINDATGSICEVALENSELLKIIKEQSQVIHLQTTKKHQKLLIDRSTSAVKPILYNKNFLFQNLQEYYNIKTILPSFEIDKQFFLDVFPRLLEFRVQSYQEFIAKTNGISIDATKIEKVQDSQQFINLVYEN